MKFALSILTMASMIIGPIAFAGMVYIYRERRRSGTLQPETSNVSPRKAKKRSWMVSNYAHLIPRHSPVAAICEWDSSNQPLKAICRKQNGGFAIVSVVRVGSCEVCLKYNNGTPFWRDLIGPASPPKPCEQIRN